MTKPLHSLSPQELADQGIPVEVALRARINETENRKHYRLVSSNLQTLWTGQLLAYRDALAIIEAQK